jgi:hypothetical protein
MRKDRLLKLADFLETVPAKSFSLGAWQLHPATKPEGKRQGECGFAGCAVGWAVHAKLFRGLKFTEDEYSPQPQYLGRYDWEAVAKLFDIETCGLTGEAEQLFMGTNYPGRDATPKQVAKRIRELVKDRSAT